MALAEEEEEQKLGELVSVAGNSERREKRLLSWLPLHLEGAIRTLRRLRNIVYSMLEKQGRENSSKQSTAPQSCLWRRPQRQPSQHLDRLVELAPGAKLQ